MNSNNKSSVNVDVYEIVTDRIIELLEAGTVPWQKPWTDAGIPMNLISKRPYRGINLWLLLSLNYERNLFLTWDQLKKIGGSVNQGEHGHVIAFWKTVKKEPGELNELSNQKIVPLLRYYKVFNVTQCRELPDNLVEAIPNKEHDPRLECENIIRNMKQCPPVKHQGQQAFYDVQKDYINMPKEKTFKDYEGYYSTLFHQMVHSTGHERRLNRKSITEMAEFGSEMYSLEELIAEIGSSYLSSYSGIMNSTIQNSVAHIGGWLTKLKCDKQFIVHASGFAQKAVDFILNTSITVDADSNLP
jgi:antirestriction protein ArdC